MKRSLCLPLVMLLVVGLLAFAPGCRRRPAGQPADADKARDALRTTLSAWQKGETPEGLKKTASITAADPKWAKGHRLVRYEITESDKMVGYDLHCRVVLVLEGPDGKQSEEKALFAVSTTPAVVVVRAEG